MSGRTELMIDQIISRCSESKILVACASTKQLNDAMDRLEARLKEAGKDCERVGHIIISGPTFIHFVDWFATNPPQTSLVKIIDDLDDQCFSNGAEETRTPNP